MVGVTPGQERTHQGHLPESPANHCRPSWRRNFDANPLSLLRRARPQAKSRVQGVRSGASRPAPRYGPTTQRGAQRLPAPDQRTVHRTRCESAVNRVLSSPKAELSDSWPSTSLRTRCTPPRTQLRLTAGLDPRRPTQLLTQKAGLVLVLGLQAAARGHKGGGVSHLLNWNLSLCGLESKSEWTGISKCFFLLYFNFMLTFFCIFCILHIFHTYFCIFCVLLSCLPILHIWCIMAYKCTGEILMGSLHILHICAYSMHICAYFNLHILAYLMHITLHNYAYFENAYYAYVFLHICTYFMHIYAYGIFAYTCIFCFCIFYAYLILCT